ncbi:histidine kinase dimerization/phosphoacceptor domain-containing protein [Streptomyces sp. NPDC015032]|uniref:histidine kinase dimerization/phosphoacceptor domain-containing protein n=1 Tax=Streptomyces sp. NPDC015032 TaxID=3364937 RepID=UPI0036FC1CD5
MERDLHDGAQQRIVALTMMLGLARLDAPPGPLANQLARAHEEAGKALSELPERRVRRSAPAGKRALPEGGPGVVRAMRPRQDSNLRPSA